MKNLKKALALVLMMMLVLSANVAAFAEDDVTEAEPQIAVEQPVEEPKHEKAEKHADEAKHEAQPEIAADAPVATEAPKAETAAPEEPKAEQVSDVIEIVAEEVQPTEAPAASEQPAETTAPEAELAEQQPEEAVTIEDAEVPLAARPATQADGIVRIRASVAQPQFGDHVKLSSELIGFKGCELSFQWQVNKGDGWQNVQNATDRDFEFNYSERMVGFGWRLLVNIEE